MDLTKHEVIKACAHYLLQVDGIGCLLLLSADRITIGGMEHAEICDVTLQTTGVEAPVSIDREADRYLARSSSAFRVNGKTATSKILLPGANLEIGSRGRLRFNKPVPSSATATLRPTAAPLYRSDIRCVVLMRDSLLFGPSGTHFPIPNCRTVIVLSYLDNRHSLRVLQQDMDSRDLPHASTSLPLNEPVNFRDIQFVLRRFENLTRETLHGHV